VEGDVSKIGYFWFIKVDCLTYIASKWTMRYASWSVGFQLWAFIRPLQNNKKKKKSQSHTLSWSALLSQKAKLEKAWVDLARNLKSIIHFSIPGKESFPSHSFFYPWEGKFSITVTEIFYSWDGKFSIPHSFIWRYLWPSIWESPKTAYWHLVQW